MRKQSGQVHSRESSATLQLTVSLLYPLEQINLYCSRRRTIMYSVEVHNGLYDTKRGRRKMGRDTS